MTATGSTIDRLTSGDTARILYVNGSGITSERTIDVIGTFSSRDGRRYLRAYCRLRHEERTFRADRVLSVLEVGGRAATAATTPTTARAAPTAVARPPAPSPVEHRSHGGRFFAVVVIAVIAVVLYAEIDRAGTFAPVTVTLTDSRGTTTVARGEKAEFSYRGERVTVRSRALGPTFTRMSNNRTYRGYHDLCVEVNSELFAEQTGLRDTQLTRLYGDADGDRNGRLSWSEVQRFQNDLWRRYEYQANEIAYSPTMFLSAGGGDCEDWAIVTALLFTFWGHRAYVAGIESDSGHHAVALVPEEELGGGPGTIEYTGGSYSGTYIPIDYDHVGSFSPAIEGAWHVRTIWLPHRIFGWAL